MAEEVVKCNVCGIQWKVNGPADKKGNCKFCGANSEYGAFAIIREDPDYSQGQQVGKR